MRILLDQAVYDMRNKGNVALLQAAVTRMQDLWPEASIEVMTAAPHLLKIYCPTAHPVSADGRHDWSMGHEHLMQLHSYVPRWVLQGAFEAREEYRRRRSQSMTGSHESGIKYPVTNDEWAPTELEDTGHDISKPCAEKTDGAGNDENPDLTQALHNADIVVGTGGGYLCDSDKHRAIDVIDRLESALHLGKRTFLVGQGVGPIEDRELKARVQAVLPWVDQILVRESRLAPELLASLGVSTNRIFMAGDDAVEQAYLCRPAELGNDVGVSIRTAHYTSVEDHDLERLRRALHSQASSHSARLTAIPISYDGHEADPRQIRQLLRGYPQTSQSWRRFELPESLIRTVGHCRIVVAGAFHAAVFALAQGIPVIGLVRSREYGYKFQGLADQFGNGCRILQFDDLNFEQKFRANYLSLWNDASDLRPTLLQRAEQLIALNQAGYQRLKDLSYMRDAKPTLDRKGNDKNE